MALRPVNSKKVAKTTDKINKKEAKSSTKALTKQYGKGSVPTLRQQRKDAKAVAKLSGIRGAVSSKMDAKEGPADWSNADKQMRRGINRGESYQGARKSGASAGLKGKTTNKIISKAYKATTKKIDKANKKAK